MTQQNLLQLAKEGNADAIASLMNRHLQPKGITAKAALKDKCLQIMLEATQVPNQRILVPFLQKGIAGLRCEIIKEVKVYGRKIGESFPDWNEEFSVQQADVSLPELAKQKDIKAITALLNEWLKPYSIHAKASLKGDCLQLMLEAVQSPDKDASYLIVEKIKELSISDLTMLKIYGKQINEEFPDWTQEINLLVETLESNRDREYCSSNQESRTETNDHTDSLDSVKLSNDLYDTLQIIFSQALACRMEKDADSRSIHEIVYDFVNGIEDDLTLTVKNIDRQLVDVLSKNHDFQWDIAKLSSTISSVFSSRNSNLRMTVRQLERISQEVLSFDFPQESDAIKEFFKGAAGEFSANLIGRTTMSEEMIVGATIGSFIAPGLGTVIGTAVGGWLSGNKKQKQIEELLSRYEKARQEVFNEWELLLQDIYDQIHVLLLKFHNIELIPYAVFQQADNAYNQANSFFKNQEFHRAVEAYSQAIQCNPLFVAAWNNKGYALQNLEQYNEAIEAYDKAISIDAGFAMPLFNKALALQALGRHSEAVHVYRKTVELSPDDFWSWIYMGDSLQDLERYDEWLETCDKAIEIDPNHYVGWYAKSCCLMLMKNPSDALDSLERAIAIDPENTQEFAKTETAFDSVRNSERFILLMESAAGVDYSQLKKLLAQKKWKEADQETARVMNLVIKNLMDLDHAPSGLDKTAISIFPDSDLATIDRLWVESSDRKYGFSVQKSIYQKFGGTEEFNGTVRDKFGDATGWRVKDSDGYSSWRKPNNFEYNFSLAPKGHLPSSLWCGDGFLENSRDRLVALFLRLN